MREEGSWDREGEKLHEVMITKEDSFHTYEYDKHYIIYPQYERWGTDQIIPGGKKVTLEFEYSSGKNTEWLDVSSLKKKLKSDVHEFN